MKTNLLSFLVFTVFSFQSAYAVKYFVTPDGSEDSDGLSWETSFCLGVFGREFRYRLRLLLAEYPFFSHR